MGSGKHDDRLSGPKFTFIRKGREVFVDLEMSPNKIVMLNNVNFLVLRIAYGK